MKTVLLWLLSFVFTLQVIAQHPVAGASEQTPSKAEYFSWINNTNEGTTEKQSQINLNFFNWLKKAYGMQLDIYAFDAGAIDGKNVYGNIHSDRFKSQFPNGFDPLFKQAKTMNTRLGIWGGPDGFGSTAEEQQARIDQMVKLCKDYNFALFKFDRVCGPLRPEKEDAFIKMMIECRKYSPDLILLNHRLGLTKGLPYATTFLWGGQETYIDVSISNSKTAPHHREGALARGLVPGLKRLTEDHGVCLSSCLDNWDDELILQAFNRNLILSPEIYGNPWLLNDNEFPKLARIFNLHRKYNKILVNGMILPAKSYGPDAVSRGDGSTRLITMKNLTWTPQERHLSLGDEIGLRKGNSVKVIQIHPHEKFIGEFKYDAQVDVSIAPFRSALFIVTTGEYTEPLIKGAEFEVVKNVPGQPILIDVLGMPGTSSDISLDNPGIYRKVAVSDKISKILKSGKEQNINFNGDKLKLSPFRPATNFIQLPVPKDAEALYEATVFSADNNALEVRSLKRSGPTHIPAVKAARDAFFNQYAFVHRGVWDKYLFDGDSKTGFWASAKFEGRQKVKGGMLRIDLGKVTPIDSLILKVPNDFSLQPLLPGEGNFVEVSKDLKTWQRFTFIADTVMYVPINDSVRFLRFLNAPQHLVEVEGVYKGKQLDRKKWRASNLFAPADKMIAKKSWKAEVTLNEMADNSYLCVALNGKHGVEGAYVAAKIDGKYVGAPDRAPSYPSNTWENVNIKQDNNYTYYIPLDKSYLNKKIEVYVLGYNKDLTDLQPKAWIWSKNPLKTIRLKVYRK